MTSDQRPQMPVVQIVYGEIIYWITIVAAIVCMIGPCISVAMPDNNVMNPHYLFSAIFAGKDPAAVWNEVGKDGFPGGHFYIKYFKTGDGFTQFGLALGCSCAIWGLLASAYFYLRDKNYLFVLLAIWVTSLIILSLSGIAKGH